MRAAAALSLVLLGLGTCTKVEPREQAARAATVSPHDEGDLRAMVTELVSSRACAGLRGQFRALRVDANHTGVAWIRECSVDGDDGRVVTLQLAGSGWRDHATAFDLRARISGTLDVSYAPATHTAMATFAPTSAAHVTIIPVGEAMGDRDAISIAVVAAIVGDLATLPSPRRPREAPSPTISMPAPVAAEAQTTSVAVGTLTIAIDLCTGRASGAQHGSTAAPPLLVRPGEVIVIGPELAPHGLTLHAEANAGAVRVGLACADQAAELAGEMRAGSVRAQISMLASVDLHAAARLRVPRVSCPVVMIAQSLEAPGGPAATLTVATDNAVPTGGALLQCAK